MRKVFLTVLSLVILSLIFSCSLTVGSDNKEGKSDTTLQLENVINVPNKSGLVNYVLNPGASGVLEMVNNIANLTVVSRDDNVFKAEYQAGFIQGHLQGSTIASARDNQWSPGPSSDELAAANSIMNQNFNYFIEYLKTSSNPKAVYGLKRLLFRMLGIYHGATRVHPENLDFSGRFLPDSKYFKAAELQTGYGTSLTFMDVYFINAVMDFWDVFYNLPSVSASLSTTKATKKASPWTKRRNMNPLRCSAFVKRIDGDIVMAHNTWAWYLSMTMSMTINVNGDMVSVNTYGPGQIGSQTDFGFNNKGLMFNETTSRYNYTQTKTDGIFIFWRSALAEEFSESLDEFFQYISLDNTGTYMNAYMLVNANTGEIGLVDMSYKNFILLKSWGGPYSVTTLPKGQSTEYDTGMVTSRYILGYNYSPTLLARNDLQCGESDIIWTNRESELKNLINGVNDINTAKSLITYAEPNTRDNIMSRFDLAIEPYLDEFGTAPFGAIDAKVITASMVRDFERLSGKIDLTSNVRGFWMRYGTAYYDGKPFIWSQSDFSSWPHPDVPDALDGVFTYLKLHLR